MKAALPLLACVAVLGMLPAAVRAQEAVVKTAEGAEVSLTDLIDGFTDSVTLYGSLRIRLVRSEDEGEVQNGSSRIGFRLRRDLPSVPDVIGCVEWQVNLVEDPTVLSAGDSTGGELSANEGADAFETRLGWLGFDLERWGQLTFGKQWGVYYDVAGWTDRFYVFGATSLGVFNAGTDGGVTGTGRAEQAIAWRVERGRLTLGLQYQANGLSSQGAESGGASLRYRVADWFQLGVAYNEADLGSQAEGIVVTTDPRTLVAGFLVEHERTTLAFNWADQQKNEVGKRDDELVLFDADGYELYGRQGLDERFGVYGGFNWRDARDSDLNRRYDIEDYYLGADWHFDKRTFAYVQLRLAEFDEDALVVGLRYNF